MSDPEPRPDHVASNAPSDATRDPDERDEAERGALGAEDDVVDEDPDEVGGIVTNTGPADDDGAPSG